MLSNYIALHAPAIHTLLVWYIVGATTKLSGIKWGVAQRIVWAWLLTIPAASLIAAGCFLVIKLINGGF